jgi:hypothetical protein
MSIIHCMAIYVELGLLYVAEGFVINGEIEIKLENGWPVVLRRQEQSAMILSTI